MSVLPQFANLLSSILTILLTCPNNDTVLCYSNDSFLTVWQFYWLTVQKFIVPVPLKGKVLSRLIQQLLQVWRVHLHLCVRWTIQVTVNVLNIHSRKTTSESLFYTCAYSSSFFLGMKPEAWGSRTRLYLSTDTIPGYGVLGRSQTCLPVHREDGWVE